jgi:hypothetical protein
VLLSCEDNIHFVGIVGSGQRTDNSPQVRAVYDETVKQAAASNLSVSNYFLNYPAEPVWVLAVQWPVGAGVNRFIGSITQGIDNLVAHLNQKAAEWDASGLRCENSKFVIAGYSQGAMVIHRLLQQSGRLSDSAANRIGGAMLLADGDRYASDGTNQGPIRLLASGVGHATAAASKADRTPIPSRFRDIAYSVCILGDGVCDAVPGIQVFGFGLHLGYRDMDSLSWRLTGRNWYRQATDSMLDSVNRVAVPPADPSPPVDPDDPAAPGIPGPGEWQVRVVEANCYFGLGVKTKTLPNLPVPGGYNITEPGSAQPLGAFNISRGNNVEGEVLMLDTVNGTQLHKVGQEIRYELKVYPSDDPRDFLPYLGGVTGYKILSVRFVVPQISQCHQQPQVYEIPSTVY